MQDLGSSIVDPTILWQHNIKSLASSPEAPCCDPAHDDETAIRTGFR